MYHKLTAVALLALTASPALARDDTQAYPNDTEADMGGTGAAADRIVVTALRTPVAADRVSATVTVLDE
ncbi:MAG TPA: TonB-dependent receptor, partial [Novosphingobium sp.]|nr:TonB-dependent receptor [Novosphingobium sp.]